jgi:hypothetical protein
MMKEVERSPQEDTMINGLRKTARTITTVLNFCVNPACLHAEKAKGCACCSRGHSKKGKTSSKTRKSRR